MENTNPMTTAARINKISSPFVGKKMESRGSPGFHFLYRKLCLLGFCLYGAEDLGDLLKGHVDLLFCYDQRGSEPDDPVVGLLAEEPFLLEGSGIDPCLPCGLVEHHTDKKPFSPDQLDLGGFLSPDALHEVFTKFCGTLSKLLLEENVYRR